MKPKKIETIIQNYLNGKMSDVELSNFIESFSNEEIKRNFKSSIEIDYLLSTKYESVDSKTAYLDFLTQVKAKRNNPRRLSKRRQYTILKYAAVFIGILVSGYIFRDSIFSYSIENSPIIVEHNKNSGNEKTTLILSDGTVINLEQTKNELIVSDNDTQIQNTEQGLVYNSSPKSTSKEVSSEPLKHNTLRVPIGKVFHVILPDGTKVWLNSGSELIYPVVFSGKRREVFLEGEGIFEVVHNYQPFIVKADNHEIEVLGTIFNVSNYSNDDTISTVLKSGSIQLNFENDSFFKKRSHIKIKPGTMAVYNRSNKTMTTDDNVDVDRYFSWRDGVFIFKNDSLSMIMKKLSRYYNIHIVIDEESLATETFSGYLNVKDDLENVINIIKRTLKFEYIIEENKLTINSIKN